MIYAGDWFDVSGDPFMASLFPRTDNGQGQIAQLNPYAGSRSLIAAQYTDAIRFLANRWTHVLTSGQRTAWDFVATFARPDRAYEITDVSNGFLAFANRNFPVAWGYDGVQRDDPTGSNCFPIPGGFVSAEESTQLITIDIEYDIPPESLGYVTTYLYHLDPSRLDALVITRYTRLGVAFRDFNVGQRLYTIAVPAQWPLVVGETAAIFIRHTLSGEWDLPWNISGPVT